MKYKLLALMLVVGSLIATSATQAFFYEIQGYYKSYVNNTGFISTNVATNHMLVDSKTLRYGGTNSPCDINFNGDFSRVHALSNFPAGGYNDPDYIADNYGTTIFNDSATYQGGPTQPPFSRNWSVDFANFRVKKLWTTATGELFAVGAVTNSNPLLRLITVLRLNPDNGSLIWQKTLSKPSLDIVTTVDTQGSLIFSNSSEYTTGANTASLFSLDKITGNILAQYNLTDSGALIYDIKEIKLSKKVLPTDPDTLVVVGRQSNATTTDSYIAKLPALTLIPTSFKKIAINTINFPQDTFVATALITGYNYDFVAGQYYDDLSGAGKALALQLTPAGTVTEEMLYPEGTQIVASSTGRCDYANDFIGSTVNLNNPSGRSIFKANINTLIVTPSIGFSYTNYDDDTTGLSPQTFDNGDTLVAYDAFYFFSETYIYQNEVVGVYKTVKFLPFISGCTGFNNNNFNTIQRMGGVNPSLFLISNTTTAITSSAVSLVPTTILSAFSPTPITTQIYTADACSPYGNTFYQITNLQPGFEARSSYLFSFPAYEDPVNPFFSYPAQDAFGASQIVDSANAPQTSQFAFDNQASSPRTVITIKKGTQEPIFITDVTFAAQGVPLSDPDWTDVRYDTDSALGKSYVHNLVNTNPTHLESVAPTFALIIPKLPDSIGVGICPGASSFAQLDENCPGYTKYDLTNGAALASSLGPSIFPQYWIVKGLTGTGGFNLFASEPPVVIPPVITPPPQTPPPTPPLIVTQLAITGGHSLMVLALLLPVALSFITFVRRYAHSKDS